LGVLIDKSKKLNIIVWCVYIHTTITEMPQCKCLTKNGKGPRCTRIIKEGDFCSQHINCPHVVGGVPQKQVGTPQKQVGTPQKQVGTPRVEEEKMRRVHEVQMAEERDRQAKPAPAPAPVKSQQPEKKKTSPESSPPIWVVLNDDGEPIGAYDSQVRVLQWFINLIKERNVDDLSEIYGIVEPIDWSDHDTVDGILYSIADEGYKVFETRFYH
jgi:hypothetical protein